MTSLKNYLMGCVSCLRLCHVFSLVFSLLIEIVGWVFLGRTCESKAKLHQLVDLQFDRSATNPKTIAQNLIDIGCPFACEDTFYTLKLDYSKHDPKIGNDKVRLVFELSPGSDIKETVKSQHVNLDMTISDIGSSLGFFLGVSAINLITLSGSALKMLFKNWQKMCVTKVSRWRDWIPLFNFLKWIIFLGIAIVVTIIATAPNFRDHFKLKPEQIEITTVGFHREQANMFLRATKSKFTLHRVYILQVTLLFLLCLCLMPLQVSM